MNEATNEAPPLWSRKPRSPTLLGRAVQRVGNKPDRIGAHRLCCSGQTHQPGIFSPNLVTGPETPADLAVASSQSCRHFGMS
jgi:hypothetical protein